MFFNNPQKYKNYDLIVVGNNLAAVISAARASADGKTVALVTCSELLLSEYSEGLLGFVTEGSELLELLIEMGATPHCVGKEYHIPAGMASKIALEYLRKNNVNIYLKAAAIGLLKADERVSGIAIATKYGAYALKGGFVASFTDRKFYNREEIQAPYIYALQMGGVALDKTAMPHKLKVNLKGVEDVTLHGDCRSDDTCVITFKTDEGYTHKAVAGAIELIGHLIKNEPAFKDSGLQKVSLRPLSSEVGYNTPKKNLLEFKSGNILLEEDYYSCITFASTLVNSFLKNTEFSEPTTLETTYGEFELNPLYTGEELDGFLGAELLKIKLPTENAPVKEAELFIAGLGAGGAAAMKSALELGCKVIGAEALPTPAGTRGQGMVSAFWHGYQKGFANKNLLEVRKFSKAYLGSSVPFYTAEALYDISFMSSTDVFYESIAFDALKDENNTVGAVLATPNGILRVVANKCIDATGDADLAAVSGVEYAHNGDGRDKVTQGYSVWGEEKPNTPFKDLLYKSDEDSISTEKYSEFLRGIFTSHSRQSELGFSALLTVRESRRIKGKYTLNMKDILRGETFDDTISVSLCKYDAHGMGSSPAYYTSIFNALRNKALDDVVTRIPLRALLPERDNGLMVVSKSISATRDAGCLVRMNPDIQNTGYAAGLIAAYSAKNKLSFEAAYTNEIKNLLIEKDILPDYYCKKQAPTANELIEKINSGDIWARAVATVYPEFLPEFEKAFNGEKDLALVISALGSEKAFDHMLAALKRSISEHSAEKNNADQIKTYAVMLSRISQASEDKKSALVPVLRDALTVLDAGGAHINPEIGIYQNSKVSNRTVPNFKALMGVVIAAETVADESLAGPLMDLSKKPNIRLSDGDEIHSVQLYLRIIAAAARCKDKKARAELEKYRSGERLFFREFADSELAALDAVGDSVLPVNTEDFWI